MLYVTNLPLTLAARLTLFVKTQPFFVLGIYSRMK